MAYNNYKLRPEQYNPETPLYTVDARREYTRLYSVARKRLNRLEAGGYTRHDTYKLQGNLPKPSSLDSTALRYALQDVKRFLDAPGSTIRGYRKDVQAHVERLQAAGLNFVNAKNYEDFQDFMEAWRTDHQDEGYSSEVAVQLFGQAVKKGLDPEELEKHFRAFANNIREFAQMPKITDHGKPVSADKYRKALSIQKGKETRLRNRLTRQAADKGIDIRDLDTEYFRKNILELEHQPNRPGYSAADYKRQITSDKRRRTQQKNRHRRK